MNEGGDRMTEENKQAFSAETSVNKYGFLYLSKEVLAAVGFQKGDKVTLQKTPEGLLVTKVSSGGE